MLSVFTIGYEGTDIVRFVETLKNVGVELLVDVRAVAVSRKLGFSKTALSSRLEAEGIGYLHLVALGDPKPGREAARAGRTEDFLQIYNQHLATDGAQSALRQLKELVRSRSCCLMCFEREPKACHRTVIANALNLPSEQILGLYGDFPRRYDHFREQSRCFGESATAAE